MDHALGVGGAESGGDLAHPGLHFGQGPRAAFENLREIAALGPLGDEVERVVGERAEVVDLEDVGVVEPRKHVRLAHETFARLGVGRGGGGQYLDRHGATEPALLRAINRAHASDAAERAHGEAGDRVDQELGGRGLPTHDRAGGVSGDHRGARRRGRTSRRGRAGKEARGGVRKRAGKRGGFIRFAHARSLPRPVTPGSGRAGRQAEQPSVWSRGACEGGVIAGIETHQDPARFAPQARKPHPPRRPP